MYYLSDICSLCLIPNKNLQSILSEDADGTVVEEKLRVILMEFIEPNIPKYICNNCLAKLNNIYTFRKSCLENITTLNIYITKLKVHGLCAKLSVPISAIRCQTDSLELENQNTSRTRIKNENETQDTYPESNIIENVFIKEEFKDVSFENIIMEDSNQVSPRNVKIEQDIDDAQENPLEDIEIPELDTCDKFQTSYESFLELNEEKVIAEHDNITSYNSISVSSTEDTTVQNPINESNKCKQCPEVFFSATDLQTHTLCHTTKHLDSQTGSFSCVVCNKQFRNQRNLSAHKRIHAAERRYKCSLCDKAFRDSSHLKSHTRLHEGVKPFQCQVCEYKFAKCSDLRRHMRTHSGHACEVCNKQFSNKRNLAAHKRIHVEFRPYKCSLCDRAFRDSSNLKTHIRLHTGEKPFQCQFCEYKFAKSTDLKRHVRIHTGEKPYKCLLCSYESATNGGLKNHQRRCHGRKKKSLG